MLLLAATPLPISGSITATADAIRFTGSNGTLNLLAPTFVSGSFYLGTNTTLNISTSDTAHSLLWTFDPTQLNGGAPTIAGSIPVFQNTIGGNLLITTFNPSVLAGSTDGLANISGLISGVTQVRLSSSGTNNVLGYAANSTSIIDEVFAEKEIAGQGWVKIIGSQAEYDGTSTALGSTQKQLALIAGYDWTLAGGTEFGVMAGFSTGSLKSTSDALNSVGNDTQGAFAGIYGRTNFDHAFLSFGLTAGISSHEDDRYINDNLAPLGVAHALGDYSSTWLSPELTYSIEHDLTENWTATPALRLSYAGQWAQEFTETGTGANATLGKRQVGVAEGSAGIGNDIQNSIQHPAP